MHSHELKGQLLPLQTLDKIMEATPERLALCPGFGQKKVSGEDFAFSFFFSHEIF